MKIAISMVFTIIAQLLMTTILNFTGMKQVFPDGRYDALHRIPMYAFFSGSEKWVIVATKLQNHPFFDIPSVPKEGIEPSYPSGYTILSRARLPIPPLRLAG